MPKTRAPKGSRFQNNPAGNPAGASAAKTEAPAKDSQPRMWGRTQLLTVEENILH